MSLADLSNTYQAQLVIFGHFEAELQMRRQYHYLPHCQLWPMQIILMDIA